MEKALKIRYLLQLGTIIAKLDEPMDMQLLGSLVFSFPIKV